MSNQQLNYLKCLEQTVLSLLEEREINLNKGDFESFSSKDCVGQPVECLPFEVKKMIVHARSQNWRYS